MATTIVTKKGSGAPAASDLVEGELAVDTTNGRLYTENSSAAVVELGSNPSGNITFGDNGKAIFGAGSDLQIYHDGSNSYIVDNGTGDLLIRAENNLFLKRTNSDETYLSGAVNGAVTLFHNNNAKIATTISGIDVTGSVTADNSSSADSTILTLANSYTTDTAGDATEIMFQHYRSYSPSVTDSAFIKATKTQAWDATGDRTSKLEFGTRNGATEPETRMTIMPDGSVGIGRVPTAVESAYDSIQLGAGGTFLSGSSNLAAGNFGQNYYVDASGNTKYLGDDEAERITMNNGYIAFENAPTNSSGAGATLTFNERMRIDATGNVGIGASSPSFGLSVEKDNGSGYVALFRKSSSAPALTIQTTVAGITQIQGLNAGLSAVNDIAMQTSGGNVGIGVSPSTKLHVLGGRSTFYSGDNYAVGVGNASGVLGGYMGSPAVNVLSFSEPGGVERMRIDAGGRVTMPYQPAFSVNPTSSQTNMAVATQVTVIFGTEVFDVGSNFASNTFTAPATGKYQLNLSLRLENMDSASNYYQVRFLTSNRSYLISFDISGLSGDPMLWSEAFSVLADMDTNDTVSIAFYQASGTAQVDVHPESYFTGYLVA